MTRGFVRAVVLGAALLAVYSPLQVAGFLAPLAPRTAASSRLSALHSPIHARAIFVAVRRGRASARGVLALRSQEQEQAEAAVVWQQATDEASGDPYWYNAETGESSWTPPDSTVPLSAPPPAQMSSIQQDTAEVLAARAARGMGGATIQQDTAEPAEGAGSQGFPELEYIRKAMAEAPFLVPATGGALFVLVTLLFKFALSGQIF